MAQRACVIVAHDQERHRVRGVRRVRSVRCRVDHQLTVAVVRRDEQGDAGLLGATQHAGETLVHGFARLHRRAQHAGVADHVAVGIIAEDEVMLFRLDGFAEHVRDAGRAHFGHQVVGRDALRGDEQALLAGVGRLEAAVEEVGHVGVLLGFGGAEHRLLVRRQHLGDDVRQHDRAKCHGKGERLVVLRHGDEVDRGPLARLERVEVRSSERPHDLSHAVGAEVEAEHAVARPDAGRPADHAGVHELVRLARLVGLLDRRLGIGRGLSDAVHHGIVGDLGAVPALVAVHRVVAPHHGGDHGAAALLCQQVPELPHERERRLRRRIAPVEPCVDRDRHLVELAQPGGGHEMPVQGMDAAVAEQSQEVERAAPLLHGATQRDERRQSEEVARVDCLRDAHNVLRHHAPGAEIEVADFAVADLSFGESHGEPRRVEQRARRFRPETVPSGRVAELDGVARPAGPEAPAVEHDQDDRGARPMPLCHIQSDAI